VAVFIVVFLGALPVVVLPKVARISSQSSPAQTKVEAETGEVADDFFVALQNALSEVKLLQVQVETGQIVPRFGEKAQAILASSEASGPELKAAVDGALQTLFLQQLPLLRKQVMAKFEKATQPIDAVDRADQQFTREAELLRPTGADWSYDAERYTLRSILEGTFRRTAQLAEERARLQQSQQVTMEVISKLQNQMEVLQQRVQSMRAGSPWALSASYRIPKTPLQVVGRYSQGRANIEVNMSPDRDPINAEAGFVKGVGPANLGISFNAGL
jgi:hypothetical protein